MHIVHTMDICILKSGLLYNELICMSQDWFGKTSQESEEVEDDVDLSVWD